MSRIGTYLGLLIVGALAVWIIGKPFFAARSDVAMNGALLVPEPEATTQDGWTRLRVSTRPLRMERLREASIADLAHSSCRTMEARGDLSEAVYRVDVAFDGIRLTDGSRPLPFSVPIVEGQCAEPMVRPDTRLVYPGPLAGWRLQRGGALRIGGTRTIRYIEFDVADPEIATWPFPFELACDYVVHDRTARQFLHSLQVDIPEVGSSTRFAIRVDNVGVGTPDFLFMEFTLGRSGCNEVAV